MFVQFMKIQVHENSLSCFYVIVVCAENRQLMLYVHTAEN